MNPKKLHPTRAADLRGYHTVACGEGGMQRDEPGRRADLPLIAGITLPAASRRFVVPFPHIGS